MSPPPKATFFCRKDGPDSHVTRSLSLAGLRLKTQSMKNGAKLPHSAEAKLPMSKRNSQNPSISPPPAYTFTLDDFDSRLAEDQLLAELAQAAEPPMVSTRSYDRYLEDVDSRQMTGDPSIAGSKKRKLEKETATIDMEGKIPLDAGKSGNLILGKSFQDEEAKVQGGHSLGMSNGGSSGSARHKRFASEEVEEEIPSQSLESKTMDGGEQLEDGGDSDDDAPEAVTVEAGFKASHATALDAVRIAEQQQKALRAKRRELDSRLKAQAEAVKARRQAKVSPKTNPALPVLLPDELLSMELISRSPTPPTPTKKALTREKMKALDENPKRPKDIKRGSQIIRVLLNESGNLPPISSAASKAIREKWLTGQRGSLGGAEVPRRKASAGFIRR